MIVGLTILLVVQITFAADQCTYINQDTASVTVQVNANIVSSSGGTSTHVLDVGASLTVSCKNTAQSLEYGVADVYTCTTPSDSSINLPGCFDKCGQIAALASFTDSTFHDSAAVEVTGALLAKGTPVTISCSPGYSQSYQKAPDQECEVWTAEDVCKEMCTIGAFDNSYTELSGSGLYPSLENPLNLKLGYKASVKCKVESYALPDGAETDHTCEAAGASIDIAECKAKCKVPDVPDSFTQYHTTEASIKEGETFTVTCSSGYKFAMDEAASDKVKCTDGQFDPIPVCKETCKLNGVGADNTYVTPTVTGGLARGQEVVVTCDDGYRLPFGTPTPWNILCDEDHLNVDIPQCQGTCTAPSAAPAKSTMDLAPGEEMSLRQPLTVSCIDYYGYESPAGALKKEFLCNDEDRDSPEVVIDDLCYVFAKLDTAGAGTLKVNLKGVIIDGETHATTQLTMVVSGDGVVEQQLTNISPNTWNEVEVGKYVPLKVGLTTVSTVDGTQRTISRNYQDIYPGPPSALVEQSGSTTNTVSIKLIISGDQILEDIVKDNSVDYIIEWNGKTITIHEADQDKVLPNLEAASSVVVTSKTKLDAKFGGEGSAQSFTVYTGPKPVESITQVLQSKSLTISWQSVPDVVKYKIDLNSDDGEKLVSKTVSTTSTTFANLEVAVPYQLQIITIRSVDVSGNRMEFYGDAYNKDLQGPPPSPSDTKFKVVTTGDSVTIKRVAGVKRSTDSSYTVLLHHDNTVSQHVLSGGKEELEIPDLALSTSYEVRIAETVDENGYGMTTFLKTFTTADCEVLNCLNCKDDSQFTFVQENQTVTAVCMDDHSIKEQKTDGTEVFVTEKVLFCNDRNQYVDANGKNYIINEVVCTNRGAIVDPASNYTIYYIIGGVGVFLVIVMIIILVVIRRKRNTGSYDAKKVKENTSGVDGPVSPETMPRTFANNAYFEEKWDNELLRAQSARSKATSYGSQELRMEIDDSDSGITGDLDTYFNPALYSTNMEDDTISTKSALV